MQPTILFDIDDTFCIHLETKSGKEDKSTRQIIKKCRKSYHAPVFMYQGPADSHHLHMIFPDWLLCFQVLLDWGWQWGFFSAGCALRNEALRDWVAQELKVQPNRILCFSRDHMEMEGGKGGESRKSLCGIGLDLEHSLLVDDVPENVHTKEEPQCILNRSDTKQMSKSLQEAYESQRELIYPAFLKNQGGLEFPLQVTALLLACKDHMTSHRTTLRTAAAQFLQSERYLDMNQDWITRARQLLDTKKI